jgi:hypothetical protein
MTFNPEPPTASPPDYGQGRPLSWWDRARADVAERIDGTFEFIGQLIALLGGVNQTFLAFGLACLGAGIGTLLEGERATWVPWWFCAAGFAIGVAVPLPKRR